MAQKQDSMIDEMVETIMDLCWLYLKHGESIRTSSIMRAKRDYILSDPVSDGIISREEILRKLFSFCKKYIDYNR